MKTLKIFLLIVSVLLVIIIGFLWYMGIFTTINVEEKLEGGYFVAGTEVIGPYSKVGVHISDVESKLKELNLTGTKKFGIYYDDPKVTPQEKCRSLVGIILDKKDFDKIKSIQLKDLKMDTIPNARAIVIEFPLKNTMSYMIGAMKAYPVFSKYMKEKKYKPVLSFEIYDDVEKKIIYAMHYTL